MADMASLNKKLGDYAVQGYSSGICDGLVFQVGGITIPALLKYFLIPDVAFKKVLTGGIVPSQVPINAIEAMEYEFQTMVATPYLGPLLQMIPIITFYGNKSRLALLQDQIQYTDKLEILGVISSIRYERQELEQLDYTTYKGSPHTLIHTWGDGVNTIEKCMAKVNPVLLRIDGRNVASNSFRTDLVA